MEIFLTLTDNLFSKLLMIFRHEGLGERLLRHVKGFLYLFMFANVRNALECVLLWKVIKRFPGYCPVTDREGNMAQIGVYAAFVVKAPK